MAGEELQVVRLRDDFYRDGFYKILLAVAVIIVAIFFLIALSVYLYTSKPAPLNFSADNEWRILPPVPLNKVYLDTPDLIQWTSEVLPKVFSYDFLNYTSELKEAAQYFTPNGWQKFLEQINIYANFNTVQTSKMFVTTNASGAPFILNQGLLEGRYAWWVQMPVSINYVGIDKSSTTTLTIQALVVRVSTLNNLYGVGIENIVISKGEGNKARANG